MKLTLRPLTPERWADLEVIFGARGCSVARGCWCMYYRVSGSAPVPSGLTRSQANRKALKALTRRDPPPGLIGYHGKKPVGWVSLGPREDYAKLARSSVMKAVDDERVWSIICFVVPEEFRGQGVAKALLEGAIKYAKRRRVKILEAYPVDQRGDTADDALWFGTKSMYDAEGFVEVARRKPRRPVVRLSIA
jgi:GNAT superfamily N-acetyltransferase